MCWYSASSEGICTGGAAGLRGTRGATSAALYTSPLSNRFWSVTKQTRNPASQSPNDQVSESCS
jgi:hypothetical protein